MTSQRNRIVFYTALCLLFLPGPAFPEGGGSNLRFLQQRAQEHVESEEQQRQTRDAGRSRTETDRTVTRQRESHADSQRGREAQRTRNREVRPEREPIFDTQNRQQPAQKIAPSRNRQYHEEPAADFRPQHREVERSRTVTRSVNAERSRQAPRDEFRSQAKEHREPERRHDDRSFRHDEHKRPPVIVPARRPDHAFSHKAHNLPPRHRVFVHGHDSYHFHNGRFYRPFGSSYILARPPFGLMVLDLPLGFRTMVSAGHTYFTFGGVFYRRAIGGYEVVPPIYNRYHAEYVTVDTDLLNVRYAPDSDEEIVAQVHRYQVLNVLGSLPGWVYVEIPDENIQGWVMERYIVPGYGRG